MKFYTECYPCLLKIVVNTCAMCGCTAEQSQLAMDESLRLLLAQRDTLTQPVFVGRFYDILREKVFPGRPVFDPFLGMKKLTNRLALSQRPVMDDLMVRAGDRLEMAVRIAATGNIIDFGTQGNETPDIGRELENAVNLTFGVMDLEALRTGLETARLVLYVTDNAGEIVFDHVLIEEITRHYPQARILCAVHGKPVLNDALEEDATAAGIDKLCQVISSGSGYAGTVLHETTPEFQRAFNQADVIIVKGQGNFESLGEVDNSNMFFLLRVKCEIVAREIGKEIGSLVLKRKKPGPSRASGSD